MASLSALLTKSLRFPAVTVQCKYFNTYFAPLLFQATNVLRAEPLKKRKRMDPVVTRLREERRKRKIEKQIRVLEKSAKTLKPIEENEVSLKVKKELGTRRRETTPLSFEEMEYRDRLHQQWSTFKYQQHLSELDNIACIMLAQNKALKALREESEELYNEAIQNDHQLIPLEIIGPCLTPPIKNYEPPDGEYIDVSRKWK